MFCDAREFRVRESYYRQGAQCPVVESSQCFVNLLLRGMQDNVVVS
jgi:hypothetical protein